MPDDVDSSEIDAVTMPAGADSMGPEDGAIHAMLQVAALGKSFPRLDIPVLQDINLSVPTGGFVTVIGPSGCGKTTLLRIVGGLETATTGTITVDGKTSVGPARNKTMVFQHFNLFPWRTALSNIAYGLELQGVPEDERTERARRYLDLVGLGKFAAHYPSELSGGMQQRVGIARALAVEPQLLLMDEPFGALDALTRERLQTELQKICASAEVAVLFVTHSIDEAIFLSDEVVVMGTRPGRIVKRLRIDLPRPRWDYDVRADPRFAEIRAQIWSELEVELREDAEDLPGSIG